MKTTMKTIRLLVTILIIKDICCQDGFSEQDYYRLQQYTNNDGQIEAATGYNHNIHREPIGSVGVPYHISDDNNSEYNRGDRSRSRKVYRIKNPFQQQQEEDKGSQDTNTEDAGTAASNQFAAVQYSLPPEDFLLRLRAENQFHQQQQLSTQVSPSPYSVTPQPQYQYSTLQPSNYDVNQQSNQMSLEPKAYTPVYQANVNSFQYGNPNVYNLDNAHSTPIPPYMSTPMPNTQYLGTPANAYVSSSSPIYLSSPQNTQQYVSSPNTIQSSVLDYNSNRVTTIGSNYDTGNESNKRRQIDHYDNSANGIRYPAHTQNQYQNDYPSSTISPTLSTYSDSWQNSFNNGYNTQPKSENEYMQMQYQNLGYNSNQKVRQETNEMSDISNSDTHRIGSMPSANNLYLNYIQPDYQFYSNVKSQTRDSDPETSQSETYSHGDYGWKLSDKKSSYEPELPSKNNYFKYQIHSVQPDSGAVSQVSFQMDSSKPYNYEHNTKPVTEKSEAEEFARAAAKAHEKYKQQLEASKYISNSYNHNTLSNAFSGSTYYNKDNIEQSNKVYSSNQYGNLSPQENSLSSAYYINSRDTSDGRTKQLFDHNKAIKNIVAIDLSNVVQNSDSSTKAVSDIDSNSRFNFYGHNQNKEQNFKQYSRPVDSFYGDKNNLYSLKSKPDDYTGFDKTKQSEQTIPYYNKHQTSESFYNSASGNKRFVDDVTQSLNYVKQLSTGQQDNIQSTANVHQQDTQQSQIASDIANILKFNDIPYRLTHNINSNSQYLRNNNFDQNNVPSHLPVRINQNVDNHHIDIAAEIINKLMSNKQNNLKSNRPEIDSQTGNVLSTINGFKVANPFNVDLKLVEDMLKGKSTIDDSHMTTFRETNKPLPMKLDITQLQQLFQLKNENNGLGTFGNSFFDIYNSGRPPYQGVKYSRSEEEPENIPIADSSNSHPIGAVIEQDDIVNEDVLTDESESGEDSISTNLNDERPKTAVINSGHRGVGDRYRHTSTHSGRYGYKRKFPKSEFEEPYPLLKPPPPHNSRHRQLQKGEKGRRRRVIKPKMIRVFKTEPLFEGETSRVDNIRPTYSKHTVMVAEDKSDTVNEDPK